MPPSLFSFTNPNPKRRNRRHHPWTAVTDPRSAPTIVAPFLPRTYLCSATFRRWTEGNREGKVMLVYQSSTTSTRCYQLNHRCLVLLLQRRRRRGRAVEAAPAGTTITSRSTGEEEKSATTMSISVPRSPIAIRKAIGDYLPRVWCGRERGTPPETALSAGDSPFRRRQPSNRRKILIAAVFREQGVFYLPLISFR